MIKCARLSPSGTHFHGLRHVGNGGRVKPASQLSASASGPSLWRQGLRCHTLPMGVGHWSISALFSGFGEARGRVPQCGLTFNRTRRYGPSAWRALVAAGRLTWSC